MQQTQINSEFAKDVIVGLTSENKFLLSKYFYDETGSKIFQSIMRMPEYYLTDCEYEIFSDQKHNILNSISKNNESFDLIELGAGDGTKTKILLSYFLNKKAQFKYSPIDISKNTIVSLVSKLNEEFPDLKVNGLVGDYFKLIGKIKPNGFSKKVILFLGSNIGNFTDHESLDFLKRIRNMLNTNDLVLFGFDMKKDPDIVLNAYNDPHGHTSAFNLNLLKRINNELGADFDVDSFFHKEEYNSETGTATSYLISKTKQVVYIKNLGKQIQFTEGEKIFMEISQKYDLKMIQELAHRSGFEIVRNFFDRRKFFVNSLWKPKK